MRQRLLHARLLTLLRLVRTSSAIAYQRQLGLGELHRRLLALLGNYDGLTSVELVALSGQEKAQISRAVKALTATGLVERAHLRAQVTLTAAGRDLYDRIMVIAAKRNAQITRGFSAAELARLDEMTRRLTDRATLLLADERQSSDAAAGGRGADYSDPPPMLDRARTADKRRPLARMAIPPLITLVSYLQRSATLAYRRETGLSTFGWRVLSQIGEHEPVALTRLIALVDRDKSQIGRTVRKLETAGQVERRKSQPGRREILLATTAAGSATYRQMCDDALRRDDYLLADFTQAERAAFLDLVARLTTNAEALLTAERAAG